MRSFLWIFAFLVLRFQFTLADTYLIACGKNGNYNDSNGREWMGESTASYSKSGTMGNANLRSSEVSDDQFYSARFFNSTSLYAFPVSTGRHWVRLYFYPFNYSSFSTNNAIFSVSVNNYVLLNNLSIVNELNALQKPYLFKEYNINVSTSPLQIKFSPSNASAAYAFINAIEVISVPDNYADDATLVNAKQTTSFGMSYVALQTMYRLNVGGAYIGPTNDSYLSRTWSSNDENYLEAAKRGQNYNVDPDTIQYGTRVANYTAPRAVFSTARTLDYNITWTFDIDPNYTYYVRLLFCELGTDVKTARMFDVYVNDMLAIAEMDIATVAGGKDIAIYKDVAVKISEEVSTLKLTMSPIASQLNSSLLNGLEIFKINNSAGSLVGISRATGSTIPSEAPNARARKTKVAAGLIVGVVVGGIVAIAVVTCLIYFLNKPKAVAVKLKPTARTPLSEFSTGTWGSGFSTSQPSIFSSGSSSQGGRYFSLPEIVDATNNFDQNLVLGVGGFGKVYKGELSNGIKFAAKRANPTSQQGLKEFLTEIEMLSKLRHRHLVSLIGYCEEQEEMILVYELMAKGTLRSHLYGPCKLPLSWIQRLEICIGAAKGLHYLHTGSAQGIIHRDVKTTNILLDENFVAKVSDFGLSKTSHSLECTHVSTLVKGSIGYLDPEYYTRQQLTEKSDVYSFGVVLFEVICARPAMDRSLPVDQVNLAERAMQCQRSGLLEDIIDPVLKGKYNVKSMRKYVQIAGKCLADNGIDRPSMGDVLWNLEDALELQKKSAMPVQQNFNNTHPEEIPLQMTMTREPDFRSETESASSVAVSVNFPGR